MTVVAVDARVLSTDTPAIETALGAMLDGPTCLRFDGLVAERLAPAAATALDAVPALTLGTGTMPDAAAGHFDVVAPDTDAATAVTTAFERAPGAAVSAALLLRRAPDTITAGLVAESTTYSMLQAGPEFRAWRAAHPATPTDDASTPRVRVDRAGAVTEITLTRAAKHNALDVAMRDQLHAALADAQEQDGPLVLFGDGPSFCSGGDLDEFGTFPDPVAAHLVRLDRSLAAMFASLADRLVVGLHGACLGAGIELPAFAGHVVASEDARIGLPEQGIGLLPGAGGTVSVTRRVGRHSTLSLLLRDGTISAAEARDWGLVDQVVSAERLRARVLEIAESLT